MSVFLRFLVVLLFSLYGGIHLLQLTLAKTHSEEAANNAKYISGIIQVAALPENLKPSKTRQHGERRLIFIGDVHGAYDELVRLLEKVEYKSSTGNRPYRQ